MGTSDLGTIRREHVSVGRIAECARWIVVPVRRVHDGRDRGVHGRRMLHGHRIPGSDCRRHQIGTLIAERLIFSVQSLNVINGLLKDECLPCQTVSVRRTFRGATAHHLQTLAVRAIWKQSLQLRHLFINALPTPPLNCRVRDFAATLLLQQVFR